MPADIALAVGVLKAVALMTAIAIPFAPDEVAAFIALTICGTFEVDEPVQAGLGMPSSAAASCSPYWVGTKNGFVVTWLTKENFQGGVFGKLPATLLALPLADGEAPDDDELHAASSADAAAVALTSPVPVSRRRRVGPSFMLSVSIASSTLGSTLSIAFPPDYVLGTECCPTSCRAGCPGMMTSPPPLAAGRVVARRRAEAWILASGPRPAMPSLMAT